MSFRNFTSVFVKVFDTNFLWISYGASIIKWWCEWLYINYSVIDRTTCKCHQLNCTNFVATVTVFRLNYMNWSRLNYMWSAILSWPLSETHGGHNDFTSISLQLWRSPGNYWLSIRRWFCCFDVDDDNVWWMVWIGRQRALIVAVNIAIFVITCQTECRTCVHLVENLHVRCKIIALSRSCRSRGSSRSVHQGALAYAKVQK
jgi:hypothetical protein